MPFGSVGDFAGGLSLIGLGVLIALARVRLAEAFVTMLPATRNQEFSEAIAVICGMLMIAIGVVSLVA